MEVLVAIVAGVVVVAIVVGVAYAQSQRRKHAVTAKQMQVLGQRTIEHAVMVRDLITVHKRMELQIEALKGASASSSEATRAWSGAPQGAPFPSRPPASPEPVAPRPGSPRLPSAAGAEGPLSARRPVLEEMDPKELLPDEDEEEGAPQVGPYGGPPRPPPRARTIVGQFGLQLPKEPS